MQPIDIIKKNDLENYLNVSFDVVTDNHTPLCDGLIYRTISDGPEVDLSLPIVYCNSN